MKIIEFTKEKFKYNINQIGSLVAGCKDKNGVGCSFENRSFKNLS
jgi:hypothetical protein